MVNLIYNLLLVLLLPVLVPYHCYRSLSRGRRTALWERFGLIPDSELAKIAGARTILVHAVSVGETMAALPLLKGLRARFPEKRLILSNVTETGRSVALKCGLADLCIYFPFDYPFAVTRVLEATAPDLVIIMETEIWPNFIRAARRMAIPVVLANGRISDRSLKRYLRFDWFFRPVLQKLSALCMQTAEDAARIRAIGAAAAAVHVAGNLKYDVPLHLATPDAVAALHEKYRIPHDAFVFTAASTHEGEEEPVLQAYRALKEQGGASFLILAPRHPERAGAVAELLKKEGFSFRLRSTLSASDAVLSQGEVLLLDTVGELAGLYAASHLVYVGGTLVATGGHNPLEPAACGVPVLFGPHMENFREIAALFLDYRACVQVADAADLADTLVALAADGPRRAAMGGNGARILTDNAGSTGRHLEVMAGSLAEASRRSGAPRSGRG
jgi:3-deoxy-D-manno-octulosonic-acid transferase